MINPNQSPVDAYTAFHFMLGYQLGRTNASWETVLALSLVWEWWIEPKYKELYPDIFPVPSQDSFVNRLTDTAAWMAGFAVARK